MGSRTLNGFNTTSLASMALLKPYNLSDLESPTSARINLGLTGNLTTNSPYLSITNPFNATSNESITLSASNSSSPDNLVAYDNNGFLNCGVLFGGELNASSSISCPSFNSSTSNIQFNQCNLTDILTSSSDTVSTKNLMHPESGENIKVASPLEATGNGIIDYITFASPIAGKDGWIQIASTLESANGNIEFNSPLAGHEQNFIQFASPIGSSDPSGNLTFASPISSTTGTLVVDSALNISNKLTVISDPPLPSGKTYSINSYIGNLIVKNETTNVNALTMDGSTNDVFVNGHIDCYKKYYVVAGIIFTHAPYTTPGIVSTWTMLQSSNISFSGGIITIPKTGLYTISASTGEFRNTTTTSGSAKMQIIAISNGESIILAKNQFTYSPSTTNAQSQIMTVGCFYLGAGDSVYVEIAEISGANISFTLGDYLMCRLIT